MGSLWRLSEKLQDMARRGLVWRGSSVVGTVRRDLDPLTPTFSCECAFSFLYRPTSFILKSKMVFIGKGLGLFFQEQRISLFPSLDYVIYSKLEIRVYLSLICL